MAKETPAANCEEALPTPTPPPAAGQASTNAASLNLMMDDPNHPLRWVHRRRMAYTALCSMLATTFYIMGPWMPVARVIALGSIIEWFYFSMASIVGAYMGFATWAAKTK